MISDYVERSVLSSLNRAIDSRRLEMDFKVNINSSDYSEMVEVISWLKENFLLPMKKSFVISTQVDGINSIKIDGLEEGFLKAVETRNYCGFYVDAYKKYDVLTSQKKIKTFLDEHFCYESPYEEWHNYAQYCYNHFFGEELFENLINADYVKLPLGRECDVSIGIVFRTDRASFCECDVFVKILNYSLKDTEITANWLKQLLFDISRNNQLISGSIKLANNRNSLGSDEWYLFDGVVNSTDQKHLRQLEVCYINSLEWITVLNPNIVTEELLDLINQDDYSLIKNIGHNYFLIADAPILKHRRKNYGYLYENLEKYLKPGFSKISIHELRPFFEDIWIPENQYAIIDETVYVCRGDFDFVKGMIEKDCAYSQYRECYNAVHNKRLIESERI